MSDHCLKLTEEIDFICSKMGNKRNPSLKLFMSFDLIDSTSFKHSHKAKEDFSQAWYNFFKNFYSQMSLYLLRAYKALDIDNEIPLNTDDDFTFPYMW